MNFIFDLDDTIYNTYSPFRRAYDDRFADSYDIDVDRLFLDMRRHGEDFFWRHARREISLEDANCGRIMSAFADQGIKITRRRALSFQKRYEFYQHHLVLDPEMKEILDYLKEKGCFISVITNGPSEHQKAKMRSMQLDRWMDVDKAIVSADVGYNKPDLMMFRIAEERFALGRSETCYVGDSYVNDIAPAKKAGWKALWFNHRHKERLEDIEADKEVFSYEELLEAIKEMTE